MGRSSAPFLASYFMKEENSLDEKHLLSLSDFENAVPCVQVLCICVSCGPTKHPSLVKHQGVAESCREEHDKFSGKGTGLDSYYRKLKPQFLVIISCLWGKANQRNQSISPAWATLKWKNLFKCFLPELSNLYPCKCLSRRSQTSLVTPTLIERQRRLWEQGQER